MAHPKTGYASGTILTDGQHLIRIGIALEPDWTPKNIYGRKSWQYINCTSWPAKNGRYVGRLLAFNDLDLDGELPSLWLEEYWRGDLQHFRPISADLLSDEVLKALKHV